MPESISIDGMEYAVNTDFRIWMEIGKLFSDSKQEEWQRIEKMLILAYRNKLPPTAEAAVRGILEFYRAGASGDDNYNEMPVLDLYDDFPMIAAAFMRDYSIDLWEERIHWWKFRALFSCLNDDNKIIKVMGYRAVRLSDISDKKQREFYRRMKSIYRLADRRSEEEKEEWMIGKLSDVFGEVY